LSRRSYIDGRFATGGFTASIAALLLLDRVLLSVESSLMD